METVHYGTEEPKTYSDAIAAMLEKGTASETGTVSAVDLVCSLWDIEPERVVRDIARKRVAEDEMLPC